jgi:hypothetical protein
MAPLKSRIPLRTPPAHDRLMKATLSEVGQNMFQVECPSCNCRVFHIFRVPVARKAKTKKSHRLRLVARCVDCRKEIRLAFGGLNPY